MSKQDRQGVRKASDIEQKYGLGQFMYDQRQSNQEVKRDLNNLGESLSTYKTENEQNLSRMKEAADKQIKQVNESISSVAKDIYALSKAIFGMVYPVGAIYISVSATNPSTLFGGTWEQIQDRFLLASGSSYNAGATGGEAEHTLLETEMPKHNHLFDRSAYGIGPTNFALVDTAINSADAWGVHWEASSGYYAGNGYMIEKGGSQPHNNMPPYLAVYVWKRTA